MIHDDVGLGQTRQALAYLEDALRALTKDVLPKNPARFALMAEPTVEHIRNLRREIEDYVGYTFAVAQQAEPDIARMLEGTDFAGASMPAGDVGPPPHQPERAGWARLGGTK